MYVYFIDMSEDRKVPAWHRRREKSDQGDSLIARVCSNLCQIYCNTIERSDILKAASNVSFIGDEVR